MTAARRRGHVAGLLPGLLVASLGGALAFSQLAPLSASKRRLASAGVPLYVPSPRAARVLSAGHASSMADVLYMWAIQHFSEPAVDAADRSRWLQAVYGTITDLDPRFRDAYWLGYLSLLVEGRDTDAAFALVDKALRNDPDFVLLAIEAAMAARQHGRKDLAPGYLEKASATGDKLAHRLLLRVRETETVQEELAGWATLLGDEDSLTRVIAQAHVRDLTMMVESATLSALVRCYRDEHRGMSPGSLAQLVTAGYLSEVPLDPDGAAYVLDQRTGAVTPAKPYRYRPPSASRRGVDLSGLGRCAPPEWRAP